MSEKNITTILVDAVHTFVDAQGTVNQEMHKLLESYPQKKIILTNAPQEKFPTYGLDHVPYEVFTLEKNPLKTAPSAAYYHALLAEYQLTPDTVIYFEHTPEAVAQAQSINITTHWYDPTAKDLTALKAFLDAHL